MHTTQKKYVVSSISTNSPSFRVLFSNTNIAEATQNMKALTNINTKMSCCV